MRSHSRPVTASITAAILLAGCRGGSQARNNSDSVRLLQTPGKTLNPSVRQFRNLAAGECAPLRSATFRLTGKLETKNEFGPPGFGETPRKDQRVEIVFLRLAKPLNTCSGTFEDIAQTAINGLGVVQLNGDLDPKDARQVPGSVDVYGWLDPGTGPLDFTQIVFWVDSIPALRAPKGTSGRVT